MLSHKIGIWYLYKHGMKIEWFYPHDWLISKSSKVLSRFDQEEVLKN